jgi:hypothetical protein
MSVYIHGAETALVIMGVTYTYGGSVMRGCEIA